jgi:hypothetical protein
MGWTSYHATNYKNGKVDRKAEMDNLFTWSNNQISMKVLKSSMVSTIYYAAVEEIRDGKRTVFAAVCITAGADRSDPYFNFAYKDMDETMGPCYYDCPKSILDLLTETDNEAALEWREKCREAKTAKRTVVHKKSVYVKAKALIDMNCASAGDIVHFIKTRYGWTLQNDRLGVTYRATANNIRNDRFFEVLEQI